MFNRKETKALDWLVGICPGCCTGSTPRMGEICDQEWGWTDGTEGGRGSPREQIIYKAKEL